jgi:chorismate mutase-like protein
MAMTTTCDGWAQTAGEQLQPLVETSARRLSLAQKVAFAKWDNGTAVEDPLREEHVIASAVSEGKTEGLDPAVVSRFFRAQIEANKAVQTSLLSTWHRAGKAPDHQAKDLATTIRPQLDEIQTTHPFEIVLCSTFSMCVSLTLRDMAILKSSTFFSSNIGEFAAFGVLIRKNSPPFTLSR